MSDQASSSIVIAATPQQVMAIIEDFPTYPAWTGAVKSAEVLATGADGRAEQVRFVIDAGILKDDYTLAYLWDGVRAVSWTLVRGQMQKAQAGSYTLTASGEQTKVDYELSVDLAIPMLGLFKRKAEKMIIDTALKELKKRAEG